MSRNASPRLKAFRRQNGICFYCGLPMWERLIEKKGDARERLGIQGSKKALRYRMCTSEHLVKRAHGGKGGANIVAACAECNHKRGDVIPEVWIKIRMGRIHG